MGAKISITTSTFGSHTIEAVNLLKQNKMEISFNKLNRRLTTDELIEQSKSAIGIIAGTESYSKEVFDQLHDLKVISRLGVGMDNIDLNVAQNKGIKVFKTKTNPAPAVAELALGLMLDVARKISQSNKDLKTGIWKKQMGNLLQGKILGIIGLGEIGKTLVRLVSGFNFSILACDPIKDELFRIKHNITYCDMDTLLKESDIVSIHLNLSPQTQNLINKEKLDLMKPESILINSSRGEIVNEEALYDSLSQGKIHGSGLDVYSQEPYDGKLTKLDNVALTPHIGAYAQEIRMQMEIEAADNLISGLNE